MFTGLIESTGRVSAFERRDGGWGLAIAADAIGREAAIGESIAVNGCCLTVARRDGQGRLEFDVLEETRRVTGYSRLSAGDTVNLERSLRAGGLIGGHFVTGHIDCTGEIEALDRLGADTRILVRFPEEKNRYVVLKGSIAIDGISLTVAEASPGRLGVWIIPHTLEVTDLKQKRAGDLVNLEFDILGKHVERLMGSAR